MILAFQGLDRMNKWFDLMITIFRSNTKTLVDINQFFCMINQYFCMINRYFCMINQFFGMINQKIIRHSENFWGSGSYSKTVRPNGFLFTDVIKELWRKTIFTFQESSLPLNLHHDTVCERRTYSYTSIRWIWNWIGYKFDKY